MKLPKPNYMKQRILLLLLLISYVAYSQTEFQKGYFINKDGDKVECFIRNEDWKNNPTKFEYKLNENSQILLVDITQVEEFQILDYLKYIKATVDIDVSLNSLNNLSYLKEPEWQKKTVFLKVLLKGKSSLYYYSAPDISRYFYNLDKGDIIQLVYKRYNLPNNKIGVNSEYKQQLYNSFRGCQNFDLDDFNNISYNSPSLSKIVIAYNECLNSNIDIFTLTSNNNPKFNLKLKGGVNSSSIRNVTHGSVESRNAEFGSILGYRFAVEGEVVLRSNNNKWSIFFELAKVQNIDKVAEESSENLVLTYSYFELPIAVRHYFFLNDDSKLSLHLGYAWDVASKFKLDYENLTDMTGESTSGALLFGAGLHFKRLLVEGRLNIKSVFEVNTAAYDANYNNLSLTLGYTLF